MFINDFTLWSFSNLIFIIFFLSPSKFSFLFKPPFHSESVSSFAPHWQQIFRTNKLKMTMTMWELCSLCVLLLQFFLKRRRRFRGNRLEIECENEERNKKFFPLNLLSERRQLRNFFILLLFLSVAVKWILIYLFKWKFVVGDATTENEKTFLYFFLCQPTPWRDLRCHFKVIFLAHVLIPSA